MNKTQLINKIIETRSAWDAVLAHMDETQLTQPGEDGIWSIKDILAHITWYEREMVVVIQGHALVGSDWWNLSLEERNALIYHENKERSLNEILQAAQQVHDHLLHLIGALTEEDLQDPRQFPGMPDDWQPWQVIASNTYEHYPDHRLKVTT